MKHKEDHYPLGEIVPSQYIDMIRPDTEHSGEKRLWLAILISAVYCYQNRGPHNGGRHPDRLRLSRREDAKCWFGLCKHISHPLTPKVAFEDICDLFDFNAKEIRLALVLGHQQLKQYRLRYRQGRETKVSPPRVRTKVEAA
jgi:hypothetical protein